MHDRIRARWLATDDTSRIKNTYLGILSEAVAKKKLALANTTDPAKQLELRCAIARIEKALNRARQQGDES